MDDLPEPWLGTEPEDKAEQGRSPQAGHETPLSLVEPPTPLSVATVVSEPGAANEPRVANEPRMVNANAWAVNLRDPDGHLLELATPGLWPGY